MTALPFYNEWVHSRLLIRLSHATAFSCRNTFSKNVVQDTGKSPIYSHVHVR
jgi:hypothetical protein